MRFAFGENWSKYLDNLNNERIKEAESSIKEFIGLDTLAAKKFLDIGSGSGLFSLAAKRMGASVTSFDYDADSVKCTQSLKDKFFPTDEDWTISEGSILDTKFVASLGKYDLVYSWGVLHHTGDMKLAFENTSSLLKKDGILVIAIYNTQNFFTPFWKIVKKTYIKSNFFFRKIMELCFFLYFLFFLLFADLIRLRNPLLRHKGMKQRGMSLKTDVIDWIGGWPFETAKPEEVIKFFTQKNFKLANLSTVGGKHGCNEFLFIKN